MLPGKSCHSLFLFCGFGIYVRSYVDIDIFGLGPPICTNLPRTTTPHHRPLKINKATMVRISAAPVAASVSPLQGISLICRPGILIYLFIGYSVKAVHFRRSLGVMG